MRTLNKGSGKRTKLVLMAAVVIMAALALAYIYELPIPNPGHGADVIWIDTMTDVPGGEMSVQDAWGFIPVSIDTTCGVSGSCPQICIGGNCRNTWPADPTGITQINQGSGISLNPNPITSTGTISASFSDTKCSTSGTCSQVCIGTECRNKWPYETTTCEAQLSGTCYCSGKDLLARTRTPCWVTTNAAFGCGASGGFNGTCCVCGS